MPGVPPLGSLLASAAADMALRGSRGSDPLSCPCPVPVLREDLAPGSPGEHRGAPVQGCAWEAGEA